MGLGGAFDAYKMPQGWGISHHKIRLNQIPTFALTQMEGISTGLVYRNKILPQGWGFCGFICANPHLAPLLPYLGWVGLDIDRCIMIICVALRVVRKIGHKILFQK